MADKDKKKTPAKDDAESVSKDVSEEVKEDEVQEERDQEEGVVEEAEKASESEESSSKDEPSQYFASDREAVTIEKHFSFMRVVFFTIVVIVSALVFFAVMLYMQSTKEMPQLPSMDFLNRFTQPSPTPTPEPSPTPTPEPISFDGYTVQVLNGSGVTGAAGDVADLLESEGFEDVTAGNADNQDYEKTEVEMKADIPEEVFDVLSETLSDYSLVVGDELNDDAEFDIVITLGSSGSGEE